MSVICLYQEVLGHAFNGLDSEKGLLAAQVTLQAPIDLLQFQQDIQTAQAQSMLIAQTENQTEHCLSQGPPLTDVPHLLILLFLD